MEVLYLSGTVEVCPAEESEFKQAEAGMRLYSGDKIKTGSNSSIGIAFDGSEENVANADSNSSLTVILKESEKIEFLEGEIFFKIGNLAEGEAFEVRTPTAVAGVLGTEWSLRASADDTVVECFEGESYVKGIDESGKVLAERTLVWPGYTTSVKRFKRPMPPAQMPESAMQKWRLRREHVHERMNQAFQIRTERFSAGQPKQKDIGQGPLTEGNFRRPEDKRGRLPADKFRQPERMDKLPLRDRLRKRDRRGEMLDSKKGPGQDGNNTNAPKDRHHKDVMSDKLPPKDQDRNIKGDRPPRDKLNKLDKPDETEEKDAPKKKKKPNAGSLDRGKPPRRW